MKKSGEMFAGHKTAEFVTVNACAQDGAWKLIRAWSNKPEMVVVFESLVSSERRRKMFEGAVAMLRCSSPEVGVYDQNF